MSQKPSIAEILAKPDQREAFFDRASVKEETRTVEVAFSSEVPVRRWYGTEVLSHAKGAVNMERLKSGRANLLVNHDPGDWVGVIEEARVDEDKIGRAVVRFGNSPRAAEVFRDVKDGILASISVSYSRDEMKLITQGKDQDDEYTVTRWTPLEVSLVTVPADHKVGVGRAAVSAAPNPAVSATTKESGMTTEAKGAATPTAEDVKVIDHAAPERLRIMTLQTLARTHKVDDEQRDQWINEGVTAEEAAQKVLDIIATRAKKGVKDNPANLGLSQVELSRYSITRAIKACVEKSWPKVAPYEAEISEAVARKLGRANAGEHTFFVPLDVQWQNAMMREQRDLVVGTASAGGYLVGTAVMGFIDILRNRSVAMRLGATTLPGLVGSVSIPKKLTSATGHWFASEAGTATESNLTFGQVPLSPKTVGGYVEISRQLLLQSTPNAEGIVNTDLASVIALAVDLAVLVGPGTAGQPTGIAATSGVGTANPTAGTAINYADMIRFQTTVAGSNAMMPGFGYVTTPTIAGILMGKPRFTNSDTPIWGGNILDGSLVGARAMTSLQVSSATMFGGDFSQVVIGEWGVLEIEANPYAQFQAGIVGVRALYSCDIGVRYAAAFAIGVGMTA